MLNQKTLKHINKLQQKKYRREYEEFMIEGIKGVEEALDSDYDIMLVIVEGNKRDDEEFKNLINKATAKDIQIEFCDRKDTSQIKTTDTFPGVLAVIEEKEYEMSELVDKNIVCLDGIKDPGNLGTIIRTANWFGINNIILSEDCVDLYNPKTVRSSMGSLFKTKVIRSRDILNTLTKLKKDHKYILSGLVLDGQNINEINKLDKAIYILGSESHGIRPEIAKILDKQYTILGKGEAESLNVAVASGILLNQLK